MSKQSPYEALYAASFPKDIVAHFDLVSVEFTEERIEVYLDEKARPAVGYSVQELRRNVFTEATVVRNFPIMGKPTHMHIRRRRWIRLSDNRSIVTDWQLASQASSLSREFAAFLKEAVGYLPYYRQQS